MPTSQLHWWLQRSQYAKEHGVCANSDLKSPEGGEMVCHHRQQHTMPFPDPDPVNRDLEGAMECNQIDSAILKCALDWLETSRKEALAQSGKKESAVALTMKSTLLRCRT